MTVPRFVNSGHRSRLFKLIFDVISNHGSVDVLYTWAFKTKKLAEKARLKYPERRAKKIGIGVVRVPSQ